MFKKIKAILILAAIATLSALCAGLVACNDQTELEEQKSKADVLITYDANGGSFFGRTGVTIIDSYIAEDLTTSSDRLAHIKLLEPTSSSRPKPSGASAITISYTNHFLAGWYKTRNLVLNDNGEVIDEEGNVLTEDEDGTYYYITKNSDGEDVKTTTNPAYTYDDLWNFSSDEIVYDKESGKYELTLYAGWVPYYTFEYYKLVDGEWVSYDKTTFDWQSATTVGSSNYGNDVIYTPVWENGTLNYKHTENGKNYTFPQISGTTFTGAYTDEACTNPIETSLKHAGSLDVVHGSAVNPVQKIYVTADVGERFYISTAQQLSDYATSDGYFEILADLDFENGDISWPTVFMVSSFTGRIYSSEGHNYTIKNVVAKFANTSVRNGGLFGSIAKEAIVQNLTFESVTFDISSTGNRLSNTAFGLFAGNIESGANISGVVIHTGLFRIGKITLGANYAINLLAGGSTEGITCDQITLQIYGQELIGEYNYSVNLDSVTVDNDGNVTLTFVTSNLQKDPYKEITIWRQNNDEN